MTFKNQEMRGGMLKLAGAAQNRAVESNRNWLKAERQHALQEAKLAQTNTVLANRASSAAQKLYAKAAADSLKAKSAIQKEQFKRVIYDPITQKRIGYALGNEATVAKTRTKYIDYISLREDLSQYKSLMKQVGAAASIGRFTDKDRQSLDLLRARLAKTFAFALSGAQTTDQEFKIFLEKFINKPKQYFDTRDVDRDVQMFIDSLDKKFGNEVEGLISATVPGTGGFTPVKVTNKKRELTKATGPGVSRAKEKGFPKPRSHKELDILGKDLEDKPSKLTELFFKNPDTPKSEVNAGWKKQKPVRAIRKLRDRALSHHNDGDTNFRDKMVQALANSKVHSLYKEEKDAALKVLLKTFNKKLEDYVPKKEETDADIRKDLFKE
jgi:hypothetical protein